MHPYILKRLAAEKQSDLLRQASDHHLLTGAPRSRVRRLRWRRRDSGAVMSVIDLDLATRLLVRRPVTLECPGGRCCASV